THSPRIVPNPPRSPLSPYTTLFRSIQNYQTGGQVLELDDLSAAEDWDADDQNTDFFTVGRKIKIDLADMDYLTWLRDLQSDAETLQLLLFMVADITPTHDSKLRQLFDLIDQKITHPINPGNKKTITFTAFSDTADYLYQYVSQYAKDKYNLNTAEVTGDVEGRTTISGLRCDLNTVLTCFSPISKHKEDLMPGDASALDILIATDCISEGQNLQDCDYL